MEMFIVHSPCSLRAASAIEGKRYVDDYNLVSFMCRKCESLENKFRVGRRCHEERFSNEMQFFKIFSKIGGRLASCMGFR